MWGYTQCLVQKLLHPGVKAGNSLCNFEKINNYMYMRRLTTCILMAICIGLSACVSSKKFKDLESRYNDCTKNRDSLTIANQTLQAALADAYIYMDVIKNSQDQLIQDTTSLGAELRYLRTKNNELTALNNTLENNYSKLANGSEKEMTDLMNELRDAKLKLQQREAELAEQVKRLKDLEDALAQKDRDVQNLKNKLLEALKGFKDSGLTVEIKNGKVYVSMSEKLLFASGSTVVDQKGVDALKELARVLEKEKEINIMVEGHTDNVPLRGTGCNKDNWDLSVARANAITKIILSSAAIEPSRITAAGRGEFFPLAPNDSPENKAKNRRTEIILTPNLDALLEIMQ
jgi:chemotaxis protein MotB